MQKLYFLLAAVCCCYINSLNAQVEIRNVLTTNHLYATEEMEEENTITTSSFTPLNYCAGSTINIPFTVNGIFGHTNIFTAQLSDLTGSFSNPINIGTINGTGNGSISSVIPANTVFGTHYRIRVVSNVPMVTGTDNGIDLIMMPVPQFNLVPETYCDNDATTYVLGTFSISNYGFISVGTGGDLVDLGGGLKRIEFKPQGKFGLVSFEVRLGECFYTFNFTVNRAVVFANNSTTHLACASEGVDLTTAFVSSPIPIGTTLQYLFSGLPVGNPTAVKATGDYTVIATTPEGCVSQTTVHVFIMPIPVFNLIPATYCDNDATTYVLGIFSITDYGFISVGTGGDMVDLGGGLKRIEFKPQGKFGLVSFEVRLGECFHTFNFIVNRAVVFANNSIPRLACASEGVNLTTAFVSSPIPTGTSFQYVFNGLPVGNPTAVKATGDYIVIATTPEGCSSQTTIHVFIMPIPVFNLIPNSYCENDPATYVLGTFSTTDYGFISVGTGGELVDLAGGQKRIEFKPQGKHGPINFTVQLGECYHTFNFVVRETIVIATDPYTKLACASQGVDLTNSYFTIPAIPPAGSTFQYIFNGLPVGNPTAVKATGDYTVIATTPEGCASQTTVHVYIMPIPVFNLIPNSYCENDPATYVLGTFSTTDYGFISVGTGGELVDLGGGQKRIEFKPLGKFGLVSFEVRLGECFHTFNFMVSRPIVFGSGVITLSACASQGVNLTTSFITIPATPPDGTTFQYLLNGLAVLNPLAVSSRGIYTIVATTPEGCSSEKNITVNILPTPVLEPIPDHYCSNDNQIYLLGSFQRQNFASVIGPGMSLTNFGGLIGFNFRPAIVPPGTYTIGANVDGCTATKSITIDPSPLLVLNAPLLSVCSPGTVNLTTVLNENASTLPAGTIFQYRLGTNPVSDPTAAGISGIYTIVATTPEGCSSEKNITVNILPTPVLEPIPDQYCSNDNQIYLLGSFQRQNFASVIGPGMSLTNFGGLIGFNFRPAVVPPGTYTIGANVDGCTATKSITIDPSPVLVLNTPLLSVCSPGTVNLTTALNENASTLPAGTIFQYRLGTNPVNNPGTAGVSGIYTIIATTPEGCSSEKNITVNILPVPVLEPIPDQYCSNDNQIYLLGSFQRQNFASVIGPGMSLTNFGGLIGFNFRPAIVSPGTYTIGANVDGCTATKEITINPPVSITSCPSNIIINNQPGLCGAVVNFSAPTATGCIASISQTAGLPGGSVFPVGTSTIIFSVNPLTGSPVICSFTVTVNDNEAPIISNMPSNIIQVNDPGKCYATVSWNLPAVTDNCPGSVLVSTYHPGDHFPAGTTSVVYNATDIHGNSISRNFTITVTENEKPDIDGTLLKVFCHDPSNQYPGPQITVNDNCGIQNSGYTIIGSTTRSGTGNSAAGLFNPGLSLVKWTVTDLNGNISYWVTLVVISPPIIISIPDAYAMDDGVDPNTVYIGYAPAASINLKAVPSGGTGGFTYLWSTGSTEANITVSPIVNTNYTVTVTDISGCSRTQIKQVNVVDVNCGNGQVRLCARTGNPATYNTICVTQNQVKNYIKHNNAYLGTCQAMMTRMEKQPVRETTEEEFTMTAYPNPSSSFFKLAIRTTHPNEKLMLTIYNTLGKLVEMKMPQPNTLIVLGATYRPGIYFAELKQGSRIVRVKLIKGSE